MAKTKEKKPDLTQLLKKAKNSGTASAAGLARRETTVLGEDPNSNAEEVATPLAGTRGDGATGSHASLRRAGVRGPDVDAFMNDEQKMRQFYKMMDLRNAEKSKEQLHLLELKKSVDAIFVEHIDCAHRHASLKRAMRYRAPDEIIRDRVRRFIKEKAKQAMWAGLSRAAPDAATVRRQELFQK